MCQLLHAGCRMDQRNLRYQPEIGRGDRREPEVASLNHLATPMRALFRISLLAGLDPEGETSGTVVPREMR